LNLKGQDQYFNIFKRILGKLYWITKQFWYFQTFLQKMFYQGH